MTFIPTIMQTIFIAGCVYSVVKCFTTTWEAIDKIILGIKDLDSKISIIKSQTYHSCRVLDKQFSPGPSEDDEDDDDDEYEDN